MALLVTYDLRSPGQDYSGLYRELKALPGWWHHLESTWILTTEETPDELWERLRPHIDDNDRLLIVEIDASLLRQGWLPRRAWEWLRVHL